MTSPAGMGGAGGAAMPGMSEQEQMMVKSVSFVKRIAISALTNRMLTLQCVDASRHGVVSGEDRDGRWYGFRTWWCVRLVHGQCMSSLLPLTSLRMCSLPDS